MAAKIGFILIVLTFSVLFYELFICNKLCKIRKKRMDNECYYCLDFERCKGE